MSDFAIRVNSAEFGRSMRALRDFDRRLYAQMRRRMRAAADPVVRDVKTEILKGGPSRTGMRAALAAGTKASISISGKKAGVTVVTSPSKLPANKQSMAKTWNKNTFSHMVFGEPGTWVSQTGHQYFSPTILRHRLDFQRQLLAAIKDAIKETERAA